MPKEGSDRKVELQRKEVEDMLGIPEPLHDLLAKDRASTMEQLAGFMNIEIV